VGFEVGFGKKKSTTGVPAFQVRAMGEKGSVKGLSRIPNTQGPVITITFVKSGKRALLVACVNLAGLMLARGEAYRREMSIRLAIGATRWTLVRQVLTENLALSVSGALLGLLTAFWGANALVAGLTLHYPTPVLLDLRP
jgi:ABC-type antimicrobial peptide transport system permease subunit